MFCTKLNANVQTVLKDIDNLLTKPTFEHKFICTHILNKLVQLTRSDGGFIAKLKHKKDGEPYLRCCAITNDVWNQVSEGFYRNHIDRKLDFPVSDESLYGRVIIEKQPVVVDIYDNNRNKLPPGHPELKRYLGVPILVRGQPIGMVGLKNKLSSYTNTDIRTIEMILNRIKYMFVNIHPVPKPKEYYDKNPTLLEADDL